MRKILFFLVINLLLIGCTNQEAYKDTSLPFDVRARDLVSRMTLDEKVSQLRHDAKAIERLDVPAYNWMNECLHGVALMEGYATVFPQSIGMAASFNTDLMYEAASIISDEARAMHHNGVRNSEEGYVCGLTFWSPNINLFRDPRWGRGQETYGEDPYLTGQMAVSFVKGLQGDHPKYLKTVSTVKHYVVHSGPEALRHEFNTISNERDFWETYMPHYIRSIEEANVESVMCAYSRLNGESCCGSDYLMNELLRDKLGFEGYIVSDCGSVSDIYDEHHLVDSFTEAAVLALKSGVDLNCGRAMTFPYDKLGEAVHKGMLDESYIDTAAYRLMLARFKLGMFDPAGMVPYSKMPKSVIDSQNNKKVALQMARESMVLLKNENNLLPLDKDIKKIAMIGPNADAHRMLYGNYNGIPSKPVSVLEGVMEKLPKGRVLYSKGCELVAEEDFKTPIPSKYMLTPDKQKGLLASYHPNKTFSGRPRHTRIEQQLILWDEFGPPFKDLEIDNFSVRWEGYVLFPETASYTISAEASPHYKIYIDDKLIADEERGGQFMQLQADRPYKIRVDFVSDSDAFSISMVHALDNSSLHINAFNAARNADAVILAVGTSNLLEEEGLDREEIELPEIQQRLIKKILKLNKPTILVILSGSPVGLDEEILKAGAVIEAWYPGQSGGRAVADVIFGDYNPAGRLPVTFYKSTAQLPPYEDYDMENRTYKYFRGEPLFEFGHGLSYTSFAYSDLKISDSVRAGDDVKISVKVKNTGKMAGDEVVQVYVKDLKASVRVPQHSLQGFERIHLKPGQAKTVTFNLSPENLALLNDDMEWMVEPGRYLISAGGRQPSKREYFEGNYKDVVVKGLVVTGENYTVK